MQYSAMQWKIGTMPGEGKLVVSTQVTVPTINMVVSEAGKGNQSRRRRLTHLRQIWQSISLWKLKFSNIPIFQLVLACFICSSHAFFTQSRCSLIYDLLFTLFCTSLSFSGRPRIQSSSTGMGRQLRFRQLFSSLFSCLSIDTFTSL